VGVAGSPVQGEDTDQRTKIKRGHAQGLGPPGETGRMRKQSGPSGEGRREVERDLSRTGSRLICNGGRIQGRKRGPNLVSHHSLRAAKEGGKEPQSCTRDQPEGKIGKRKCQGLKGLKRRCPMGIDELKKSNLPLGQEKELGGKKLPVGEKKNPDTFAKDSATGNSGPRRARLHQE